MKSNDTTKNGLLFVSYHKPFKILKSKIIFPIHAGRLAIDNIETKDGILNNKKIKWLMKIKGDDSGINLSKKNREYCECTVLYWIWKNVNFWKYKYIGLLQYHRYFIFNNLFDKSRNNLIKKTYQSITLKSTNLNILKKINLNDEAITDLMKNFDCIIPYPSNLQYVDILSIYEDYVKIDGLHIDDLLHLENLMIKIDIKNKENFIKYLESPNKLMYQMFVTKPKVFNEYCKWLFTILFELEKSIDTSYYSINGKRTMGYLAEILYGYYFLVYRKDLKIKNLGIAFIK